MLLENIDIYSRVFLGIAAISTLLFVIKLLLMFIGGDVDTDIDTGTDFHHINSGNAFVLLSVETVLAFLMGFGWAGLAVKNDWHGGNAFSMLIAAGFGFAMMVFMAFLMMQIKKLNKTPKYDIYDCIGTIGTAYTELKPERIGQVQIVMAGQLKVLNAINKSKEIISSFSQIMVTNVENNMLIVSRYEGDSIDGNLN